MRRSLHRVIGIFLLLLLVLAAFSGGKAIGAKLRPQPDDSFSPWFPGSIIKMGDKSAPSASPKEVFASVLDKVQQDFVATTGSEPVSNAHLTEGAIGRMIASLNDPDTRYLNPAQANLTVDSILGTRFGIGAELAIENRGKSTQSDVIDSFLTIKSVDPNGPAERAGLRAGDRILDIDDRWIIAYPVPSESSVDIAEPMNSKLDDKNASTASTIKPGISAAHAIRMLSSGTSKTFRLTVNIAGDERTRQISVTTGKTIVQQVVHHQPAPGVTYMRLTGFNADEAAAVDSVLDRRQDWANGLIIDLRQNTGGVESDKGSRVDGYDSALDLIRHVAQKPLVGQIERKPRVMAPILLNDAKGLRPSENRLARVAVLVDGSTSNIAELAAAGMRDAGGAKLIGSHTYGDDVLSNLSVMKEGGAIKSAAAHLFTSAGVDLSRGLAPDIEEDKASAIGSPVDRPLMRAIRFAAGR